MEHGLYLNNIDFILIDKLRIGNDIQKIFFGNYGCLKACPNLDHIVKISKHLEGKGHKLHYISPKLAQSEISTEYARICSLIEQNISVSINDWGLLYKLRNEIKSNYIFFLGRLLTPSIINWIWHPIFTKDEDEQAKDYLYQNTFYHSYKMQFFKEWNIAGIEVNTYTQSEASYNEIKKNGFKIIGYSDDVILSVSRSCPHRRVRSESYQCFKDCQIKSKVEPSLEKHKELYPELYLKGNVIYGNQVDVPDSVAYDILVNNYKN